jgi:hypothetical protein
MRATTSSWSMRSPRSAASDTALHSLDKLRLTLQHAGNGFLDYLRGILAFAGGELLKLGFRVGSEMYFHGSQE